MKKVKAFTLAEILITLSIIGVVAALTIPTLIQRTGDEEIVSKLSKAYSTLSQATEAIMTENGGVTNWALSDKDIYELYKKNLRLSKDCGTAAGCWKQDTMKCISGSTCNTGFDNNGLYKVILSDGMQIVFDRISGSNTFPLKCNLSAFGSNNICYGFNVDVNGTKGPNTRGRDHFLFALKKDGFYPIGCDSNKECRSGVDNKAGDGFGCTCQVLQEGKMDY